VEFASTLLGPFDSWFPCASTKDEAEEFDASGQGDDIATKPGSEEQWQGSPQTGQFMGPNF
jgi:hypothetical protein